MVKEQRLYEQYLKLQSNEWKKQIIGYKKFKEPGKDVCIKVIFTWGWLRVFMSESNQIEWY